MQNDRQLRCAVLGRTGFSLIEVVLTVLILGILASVATPRFTGVLSQFRVDAAAARIAADLKYAGTLARVSSREVEVEFRTGSNAAESWYRFTERPDPNRPGLPFSNGDNRTWYTIALRNEPYSVILVEAPESLTYNIYGMPNSSESLLVRSGTRQRTVNVDETTGSITIL